MQDAFEDGLVQEILGKYFEGRPLGGTAAAELMEKTPEERRAFLRAMLMGKIEKEGTDRFISEILDSTVDAIANLIEERLDLCSVCGEKHGPECVKHLEATLRQQSGSFRAIRVKPFRTYRSADDLVMIATRMLVAHPSFEEIGFLSIPETLIEWSFVVAEQLLKEGFGRRDRIEREINPEVE